MKQYLFGAILGISLCLVQDSYGSEVKFVKIIDPTSQTKITQGIFTPSQAAQIDDDTITLLKKDKGTFKPNKIVLLKTAGLMGLVGMGAYALSAWYPNKASSIFAKMVYACIANCATVECLNGLYRYYRPEQTLEDVLKKHPNIIVQVGATSYESASNQNRNQSNAEPADNHPATDALPENNSNLGSEVNEKTNNMQQQIQEACNQLVETIANNKESISIPLIIPQFINTISQRYQSLSSVNDSINITLPNQDEIREAAKQLTSTANSVTILNQIDILLDVLQNNTPVNVMKPLEALREAILIEGFIDSVRKTYNLTKDSEFDFALNALHKKLTDNNKTAEDINVTLENLKEKLKSAIIIWDKEAIDFAQDFARKLLQLSSKNNKNSWEELTKLFESHIRMIHRHKEQSS